MQTTDPFAAEMLRASATGLADLASERLVQNLGLESPALGMLPRRAWKKQFEELLTDLAQALEEGRHDAFLNKVEWFQTAFAARDFPESDLIAGLECLGEILSDELPETTGMGAVKLIRGALDLLQATRPEVPPILDVKKEHGTLTARYMTALLEGNRGLATQLVLDPVRSGALTVRDALLHVCEPAQREIGRMWHLNEISISDEHAVSATTIRVISQIMTFAPSVEPTGKTVLAASIGDDSHDIGLRLVSELFELDGWKVIFLGSRLPPDDFAWAAKEFVPDLALLSAATDAHRSNVNKAITLAREVHPELAVLIGGPGFESKEAPWTSSGASACGVRTADAVQVGRELVGLPANP